MALYRSTRYTQVHLYRSASTAGKVDCEAFIFIDGVVFKSILEMIKTADKTQTEWDCCKGLVCESGSQVSSYECDESVNDEPSIHILMVQWYSGDRVGKPTTSDPEENVLENVAL